MEKSYKLAITIYLVALVLIGASIGFSWYLSHNSPDVFKSPYSARDSLFNSETKEAGVVRLHDMEGHFFCSATIISNNYAITAGHCLANNKKMQVRTAEGVDIGVIGHVAGISYQGDVGAVTGDFSQYNAVQVVFDYYDVLSAIIDSSLFACGFPWGGRLICIPVVSVEQYGFQFIGISYFYPGMSGGPVFDGKTRKLVGVVAAVPYGKGAIFSPTVEIFANLGIPVAP